MKKSYFLLASVVLFISIETKAQEDHEDHVQRELREQIMTRDPKTRIVPRNELEVSRRNMLNRFDFLKRLRTDAAIPNITWSERGPNDVGGRTRALMWDPNDATKKKLWAGGVAGGLWFNNDATSASSSWQKVNDFWDNIAISCIAYDPSNTQIMYVGTGEKGANDVGTTGQSAVGGGGIWKTIDGGLNWQRIASTTPDYTITDLTTPNKALSFQQVQKIVVNSSGKIFAATWKGLLSSSNGGTDWDFVAGTNAPTQTVQISDLELGTDNILYVGIGGEGLVPKVLKSTTAVVDNFTEITPSGTFTNGRVEIALAPSTAGETQKVYVVAPAFQEKVVRFFKSSTNAGTTWDDMTIPTYKDIDGTTSLPFVGSQGDYDLILGTHATNPNILYAAGVGFSISKDGGATWMAEQNYADQGKLMHVDHHSFAARPGYADEAVFGNDGGVYYSNDWATFTAATPSFSKRNTNYNVTQFFTVAMPGDANNGLIMGGAQDNGVRTISSSYGTVGSGHEINDGDGGRSFFDQDDANITIVSYTNCDFTLKTDGPTSIPTSGIPIVKNADKGSRGSFINSADYDSQNNTLYLDFAKYSDGVPTENKIRRYKISGTSPNYMFSDSSIFSFAGSPLKITVIKVASPTSLYLGTQDGDVYKTSDLPTGQGDATITLTKIMDKATTAEGNVSSIDFVNNGQTMVVTKSNYNIESVFYTQDGAVIWESKDKSNYGLPNMPIRYGLINPENPKQVFLATELGVWSTSDITAANPGWEATNTQLANVRTDMLAYRPSDKTVAVATHGRGIFTTKLSTACTPPATPVASVTQQPTCNTPTGTIVITSPIGTSLKYSKDSSTYQLSTIFANLAPASYSITVKDTVTGCVSTALSLTVNPSARTPTAPIVTSPVDYKQGQTAVALTATGSNLQWYSDSTGGIASTTAPIPSTTDVTSTNYYVSQKVDSCESARSMITVNVAAVNLSEVCLNIKVFLQGNFSNGTMNTLLNVQGLLPGQTPVSQFGVPTPAGQPFNATPWNYTGTESATLPYDLDIVDWILVSLRTSAADPATTVYKTAALLRSNGNVKFLGACPTTLTNSSYYVVVDHRNHVGAISHQAVNVSSSQLTYDFSLQNSYIPELAPAYGQILINGVYCLFAADNRKAIFHEINVLDENEWRLDNGKYARYLRADINLDGEVNILDNIIWRSNNGKFSGVLF